MKATKETVRKYYKYVDTPWTQPVLTSDGTIGGSEYGCSADSVLNSNYVYRAFDGNTSTYWQSNAGFPHWILFYSPVPLLVSSVHWLSSGHYSYNGKFQGSNDGSSWVELASIPATTDATISVSTSNTYKYFRWYLPDGTYTHLNALELTLTAQQRDTVESTVEDYDFYIDTNTYKVPMVNDIYYGVNQ